MTVAELESKYHDEEFLMVLESAAFVYRDLMPHAEPRRVYDQHRAEAEKRLFAFVDDLRDLFGRPR
jgi:hypothetical protein